MESTPLLQNKEKEEKSKLGNLLKANLVFLVYQLSVNVHDPVLTQYIYQRYSDEVFDNSTKSASTDNQTSKCYVNESDAGYILQERIQDLTSNCQTIIIAIGNSTAIISCMFLGAYSDFLGRRFLFICPLVGQIMKNILTIFIIYGNLDLKYLYLGEVMEGVSGGYNGVIMAGYAYTADNTTPKNARTIGIAVIDFTTNLATAVSQVITGYFIKHLGYLYPSITTTSLMLLSLILVIVLLPETINKDRRSQYPSPVKAVKNVFGFYFSKDFGQTRGLFWLSLTAYFLTYFSASGVFFLEYLFQLNLPFCWGPELIGYFNMASSLSRQVLGIPVIKLLHFRTSDPQICIITTVILAGSYILNGVANTDVMLFLTVLPSGIAAPLMPALRAVMSRMAPPEMQGSLFAGIGLVNIISSGTGSTVFNEMYNATVKMLRGFVFFASAGCQLLCAVIMINNIAKVVGHNLKFNVDFVDGDVLLDGTAMGVNQVKSFTKCAQSRSFVEKLSEKPLHRVYMQCVEQNSNPTDSFAWMKSAGLKYETEGFLFAAQDQSLPTRNRQNVILNQNVNMKCRQCNEFTETVQHLVSGCPSLAQTSYLKRHDGMARCFYYRLRHACGFDPEVRPWCDPEHVQGVMENDKFKLLWNRPIYSLRKIPANKPDLVLFDKANEFIYIIGFSVPFDSNVIGKIREKHDKYADLAFEMSRLHPKYTVVRFPIVLGALGLVPPDLLAQIRRVPGFSTGSTALLTIWVMQKAAVLGSLHILQKVLGGFD